MEPSPTAPVPPYAPPPYGPPPYAPPVPMTPRRAGISTNTFVLLTGLFIGVLLFAGMLSFHAALLIPPPCTGFCQPPTDPAIIAYRDTIRILGWVSVVAMDLAVSFAVMMAWVVGALKGDIPEGTRRGIFVFATVFLAVWLIFSWISYSIFRSLVPFI